MKNSDEKVNIGEFSDVVLRGGGGGGEREIIDL